MASTICAITTPHGISAVGMIKVSGDRALETVWKCFTPIKDGITAQNVRANSIHYGWIKDPDTDEEIDDVVVNIYRSPASYTGEDVAEISCHGSPYILSLVLKLLVRCGATLAEPGEFTRRAFSNGKMDLSQAEAVADVIASTNRAALRMSMTQMRGGFSKKIAELRQPLIHFCSLIELELDFSEEEVEFADRQALIKQCSHIIKEISLLRDSFETGQVIKDGIPVAIVGSTNAGKSTLLNSLVQEERAIVSDIDGTTRDTIEDTLIINGQAFRLIDTAGIRRTEDLVESKGIERSYKEIEKAALILWLIDMTKPETDLRHLHREISNRNTDATLIAVLNKADQCTPDQIENMSQLISPLSIDQSIIISAKRDQNVEQLKELINQTFKAYDIDQNTIIVSNIRHATALSQAIEYLQQAQSALGHNISGDLVAQDLRAAITSLGEIIGDVSSEDILHNIFAHFCIGK